MRILTSIAMIILSPAAFGETTTLFGTQPSTGVQTYATPPTLTAPKGALGSTMTPLAPEALGPLTPATPSVFGNLPSLGAAPGALAPASPPFGTAPVIIDGTPAASDGLAH